MESEFKLRIIIALFFFINCGRNNHQIETTSYVINIFQDNLIHFSLVDSIINKYETVRVGSRENGREVVTQIELPDFDDGEKIIAKVNLRPIPKDLLSVYDPWDRAGHIRLERAEGPDVEIMKFMTAYGGKTEWEIDISNLAPLLKGSCTFTGWIDTWVTPGWRIDFSLIIEDGNNKSPEWVEPIFYKLSYELEEPGDEGIETTIIVPPGMEEITLNYLVSGHCTDGRGADEFESKDNVLYIDNKEILRFRPWRKDCKQFRSINPYTRRWSSGDWSSDFEWTNWCPGDKVDLLV